MFHVEQIRNPSDLCGSPWASGGVYIKITSQGQRLGQRNGFVEVLPFVGGC